MLISPKKKDDTKLSFASPGKKPQSKKVAKKAPVDKKSTPKPKVNNKKSANKFAQKAAIALAKK